MPGLVTGTWGLSVNQILMELTFLGEGKKDNNRSDEKVNHIPC